MDYIVQAIATIDPIPPACQAGDPHSIKMGSIDGDLMARMPHNHPLFMVDNSLMLDMIETSVRGHDVAAIFARFRHAQDGHGALLDLQSQHAGKVIYEQLVKDTENILKNRTWLGSTLVTLSQDCTAKHTSLSLSVLSKFQLRSQMIGHVTYLYDSFKAIDPSVLAAMAAVCQDDTDKRINFENAFTFLEPFCLVLGKATKKGRVSFEANVSSTGMHC